MSEVKNWEVHSRWEYESPDSRGYTVIEVLEFLKGRSVDDVVKAYVHALRPSSIRICRDGCTCDAVRWRVTIWLNGDDTIRKIEQEVEVAIYPPMQNGHDLGIALKQPL